MAPTFPKPRARRCPHRALLLLLGPTISGCGDHDRIAILPVLDNLRQIVPSAGLPEMVSLQNANNNLDVVAHDDRVFLAFRTAPSHWASSETELYVVSSTDEHTWTFETRIHLDTDLREPRLLSWNNQLFLYFAVLGDDPLNFQPHGMMVTEYLSPQHWTEPQDICEPRFIPWRAKVVDGKPYLIGYVAAKDILDAETQSPVHWLTTDDGYNWGPAVGNNPVVIDHGGTETDFVLLRDGSLVAVTRNEHGDETGFGSKTCVADAAALDDWRCTPDPRKFDSPLVFEFDDYVYLIGRRNLTATGNFDLGLSDLDHEAQRFAYEGDYWFRPKRCSLWLVDPADQVVRFLYDLPSRGDTCFASILPRGPRRFAVYNYTSPLDGPDVNWMTGQTGPTSIYRIEMSFP